MRCCILRKFILKAAVTAFTFGSASVTFAANSFSDVQPTHWAYKAVTELAEVGVIEGYGDYNADTSLSNKFNGGRNITRYEMAQMIAKALARVEDETSPFNVHLVGHQWHYTDDVGRDHVVDGAVKAFNFGSGSITLDELNKLRDLVYEFQDELNLLGVRVSDLEAHSDFVKWTGELRYLYWSNRDENSDGDKTKSNTNRFELRLFPTVTINDHWKATARLTARNDMKNDSTTDVTLSYIYAEGKYGDFGVNIGKIPNYSYNDEGLVSDHFFSGVQLTYGKKFQGIFEAGRWNLNNGGNSTINSAFGNDPNANYWGLQLNYNGDRAFAGIGYRQFKSDGFKNLANYGNDNDKDSARILSIGANYRFGDLTLAGAYARNTKADNFKSSHNISLSYKGANRNKPNSWGVYAAYRYISPFVSLAPTYDTMGFRNNRKGWEGGLTYTPFKNIVTSLSYFKGKQLDTGNDSNTLWARARFWF